VADYDVVAGNPCKVISHRSFAKKAKLLMQ
jgi:acetyltransferase-like isoleucine patch superfamily enzyme